MKKQIKKITKVTKKDNRKELVVNLSNVNDIDDLYFNYAIGKCNAGIPLNNLEFTTIYRRGLNDAYTFAIEMFNVMSCLNAACNEEQKKDEPWYKKVWNKITSPFKKNK